MKKTGKLFLFLLTVTTCLILTAATALAAGKKPTKVTRIGAATRTVSVGQEVELKVKTNPNNANDNYLRWEIISGKDVLKFDDSDKNDDDVDFRAKKTGTAKVRCYISGKKKTTGVTFTVKVKKTASGVNGEIARYGKEKQTKTAGQEFELKVKKSKGLKDSQLRWSIADTKIVAFAEYDDDDLHDDEVEFLALKPGTTKITCKIKGATGKNTSVTFKITVKKASAKLAARGSLTKTVPLGDDFDLEVKKSGVSDSQLKWTIANKSIVRFDDNDTSDDEVDFRAIGIGTTTVTCSIKNMSGADTKVTYTINVVAGNGYDDDDDYFDEDDDYHWDD